MTAPQPAGFEGTFKVLPLAGAIDPIVPAAELAQPPVAGTDNRGQPANSAWSRSMPYLRSFSTRVVRRRPSS